MDEYMPYFIGAAIALAPVAILALRNYVKSTETKTDDAALEAIVNAGEQVTGKDLDGDGDVGKS